MRWKFRSRKKFNLIRFQSFNVLIDNKMIFMDSFPFTNGRPKATKKSEEHVIFNYANVLVAGRIFTGYEKEFSD